MANRKATVLNPAGYQEQLPDDDNLLLTAAPSDPSHGTNKGYVDTADAALQSAIDTTNANLATEISDRTDADSNLQDQIDLLAGGSLDGRYVERAGDDMTGNLTLGTDKITLNATDGSSNFKGNLAVGYVSGTGCTLNDSGQVFVQSGTVAIQIQDSTNSNANTVLIDHTGEATFSGALEAASIDGGTY